MTSTQTEFPVHTSIREYALPLAPEEQTICTLLSEIISQQLPDAEQKIWHGHPVWFLDGNPVVGYSKMKSCIRLLFWSGQSFEEPDLQPEGSFKAAEIRYTQVSQISPAELCRWLQKLRKIQWYYKNLIKRKGKLERLYL